MRYVTYSNFELQTSRGGKGNLLSLLVFFTLPRMKHIIWHGSDL
ncbi:hypothetical protein DOT_4067 [Desulfosporosinus sp. OT]|nr:hypothetical protein DOT_4067 [Desulfosporosinus sp. OT]